MNEIPNKEAASEEINPPIVKDSTDYISYSKADSVLARAKEVLNLIKTNNFEEISKIVHPKKGLLIAPYGNIDLKNAINFDSSQIKNLALDFNIYFWGFHAGSGDSIKLTYDAYVKKFICDKDFLNADKISHQPKINNQTSAKTNIYETFPNTNIVEFKSSGFDKKYEGMDWVALYLVFENHKNFYFLSGIIHDQWVP